MDLTSPRMVVQFEKLDLETGEKHRYVRELNAPDLDSVYQETAYWLLGVDSETIHVVSMELFKVGAKK